MAVLALWIIFLTFVAWSDAGCPRNVDAKVKHCMSLLGANTTQAVGASSIFLILQNLNVLDQQCKNGAIENTFTCLHNLYIQCAKSKEGIQHLELNINFNHWQRSIHELCDNILFLKTNARCEDQAQKEYVGCLMDVITNSFHETEALKRELESSYHLSKSQRTEALLASLCSVTLKTIDCVRGPYQRYCPVKMKNLIVRTIEGFMHPKCAMLNQPQVPDYDSSEEVVVPVSKSHEIQVVLDSKSHETGYDVNSGDQDQRHGVPLMQDEVIETPKEKPLGQKASKLTDGKNGVQGRQASWVGSWLFPLVLLGLILLLTKP